MLWRKPKHGGDIDCGKPADRPVKDRTLMRGKWGEAIVRGLVERRRDRGLENGRRALFGESSEGQKVGRLGSHVLQAWVNRWEALVLGLVKRHRKDWRS